LAGNNLDIFWLQILRDHSFFLLTALEEKEEKEKEKAIQFQQAFNSFLEQIEASTYKEPLSFHKQVLGWVQSFKRFKLHLVHQMLNGKLQIDLVPTFINHMINELEEYERILSFLIKGKKVPNKTTVHHHLLWLLDASGHSSAIASSLDDTEYKLFEEASMFKKRFNQLYLKSVEYQGFLRTKHLFPSLDRLDLQGTEEIALFSQFLQRFKSLLEDNLALADISTYLLDHMLREECYYLNTIQELNPNIKIPPCDYIGKDS